MENDTERFFDFSDHDWIVDAFDSNHATHPTTKVYAEEIQKYLRMNNPIEAIKGLIALQAATAQTLALEGRKQILTTNILLSAIVAILAYIGYILTLMK